MSISESLNQLEQDLADWGVAYTERARLEPFSPRPQIKIILKLAGFKREVVWPLFPGEVDDAVGRLHLPSGVTVRWEPINEVLLTPR